MPDDRPLSMPVSAPLVGDQGKRREAYAKRKPGPAERPDFAADDADSENEYPPSAIERPDPNQPLYEALDRLRAVEPPPEPDTGRRAKAVKAYQEQTTRSVNR